MFQRDSVFQVNIMIRRDVCNKAERTAREERKEKQTNRTAMGYERVLRA